MTEAQLRARRSRRRGRIIARIMDALREIHLFIRDRHANEIIRGERRPGPGRAAGGIERGPAHPTYAGHSHIDCPQLIKASSGPGRALSGARKRFDTDPKKRGRTTRIFWRRDKAGV